MKGGRRGGTFVEVRAVVVGFYAAFGVRGVDVEGVQVGADGFDGTEALDEGLDELRERRRKMMLYLCSGSAGFKDLALGRERIALGFVGSVFGCTHCNWGAS